MSKFSQALSQMVRGRSSQVSEERYAERRDRREDLVAICRDAQFGPQARGKAADELEPHATAMASALFVALLEREVEEPIAAQLVSWTCLGQDELWHTPLSLIGLDRLAAALQDASQAIAEVRSAATPESALEVDVDLGEDVPAAAAAVDVDSAA